MDGSAANVLLDGCEPSPVRSTDANVLERPADFYTAVTRYLNEADPTWDDGWGERLASEAGRLRVVLGEAAGRSALDCPCDVGAQAISLANSAKSGGLAMTPISPPAARATPRYRR